MERFNKIAFTLAETLIVIGIIGVVAALTLPNLNSSTGDKEKVVKLKKIYSNLEQAFGMAEVKYGPLRLDNASSWYNFSSNNNPVAERIFEFMKISKTCGYTNNAGCFDKNSGLDGSDFVAYKAITADGMSLYLDCFIACWIYVDIDGPNKGEGLYGKDIFGFSVTEDKQGGIAPLGTDSNCLKYKNFNCTHWVINHENFDYLKADANGKCINNNSIILDGTSNITCK